MKKIIPLFILVILGPVFMCAQFQMGQTFKYQFYFPPFDFEISDGGDRFICINPEGHAVVYEWDGLYWVEKGHVIETIGDGTYNHTSISGDGNVVAIFKDSTVNVYTWNGNSWNRKGLPMDNVGGHADWEFMDMDLSYSGDDISIFSIDQDLEELYVKSFSWDSVEWMQTGGTIKIEEAYLSSYAGNMELSGDGHTLIFGCSDCLLKNLLSGAFVYHYNGVDWTQQGGIITRQDFNDNSLGVGNSVSISGDGHAIAVSSWKTIKVFEWSGQEWIPKGQEIKPTQKIVPGVKVVIDNSGDKLVFSEPGYTDEQNSKEYVGRVQMVQFNGANWSPVGSPIVGIYSNENLGYFTRFAKNGDVILVNGLAPTIFSYIRAYSFSGVGYLPVTLVSSSPTGCDPGMQANFKPITFNISNGQDSSQYYFIEHPVFIPLFDSVIIRPLLKHKNYSIDPVQTVWLKDALIRQSANGIIRDTFCLIPKDTTSNDIKIDIIIPQRARPGRNLDVKIVYYNIGTSVRSGTIQLFFDGDLQKLIQTDPPHTNSNQHSLTWEYKNLFPFEKRSVHAEFELNRPTNSPPLNSGDKLFYSGRIEPSRDDLDVTNNFVEADVIAIDSFDPNDKRCMQGDTILPESVGKRLTYVIRFENVGSAEAIDISIRDFIDTSRLDIGSFELVDASHPPLIKISEGNLIEFIFKDINLPFNDEDNDGYVAFSMLSKKGLTIGDSITNQAAIYFDFNLPIITNEAVTEIQEKPTSTKDHVPTLNIHAFPNPANDRVQITADEPIQAISLLTLDGRIVRQEFYLNASETSLEILLTELPKGIYMIRVEGNKSQGVVKLVKE